MSWLALINGQLLRVIEGEANKAVQKQSESTDTEICGVLVSLFEAIVVTYQRSGRVTLESQDVVKLLTQLLVATCLLARQMLTLYIVQPKEK